ncbi:hypothetical protein [Microbacterium binotii]|uniref:Uncharacterized protein n=1 Tax=Microbacterium binotii TaxID=462710 RepID=A0ABP6BL84_9MICO
MDVSWEIALGWRMGRQGLGDPTKSVADVLKRLLAIPAWSGDPAHVLAVRSAGGTLDAAHALLSSPDVVRTFAFGGATAFTTARAAADLLALRAAGRQWERRSWQSFYRLTPA